MQDCMCDSQEIMADVLSTQQLHLRSRTHSDRCLGSTSRKTGQDSKISFKCMQGFVWENKKKRILKKSTVTRGLN